MGKKSTPEVPEAYKLEDLLKYNTDLNRFDSENPFGTQNWSQEGDRWKMTQAVNPEFQGLMDKQLSFLNRGNPGAETPGPMRDAMQALMDKRSNVWGGTPGYHPDVPSNAQQQGFGADTESMMPGHTADQPAPAEQGNKMAEALSRYGDIQGNEWKALGGAINERWKAKR